MPSQDSPICCLPPELLTYVVKDIDLEDGINLSFTCRGMHLFMTPIIEYTLNILSYRRATRVIRDIVSGTAPTRQKATILNIVVSNPHVRSLARAHALKARREVYPDSTIDRLCRGGSRDVWETVLGHGESGYSGNVGKFSWETKDFNRSETRSFLEEWYMPFSKVASSVVDNGECVLLEILGKNRWVSVHEVINRSVLAALTSGGTERSLRMFETALKISINMPKRVRVMFLLTDFKDYAAVKTPWCPPSKSTTVTVFEVCSLQAPDCETAAKILRVLLNTLKMGAIEYPAVSLEFLKHAFMVALRTAIEAGPVPSLKLRVLETWLECCEDILVQEGHTKWRMALKLGDAVLLREILCVRKEFEPEFESNPEIIMDWLLKVELWCY